MASYALRDRRRRWIYDALKIIIKKPTTKDQRSSYLVLAGDSSPLSAIKRVSSGHFREFSVISGKPGG
jgi:hypothetical protein